MARASARATHVRWPAVASWAAASAVMSAFAVARCSASARSRAATVSASAPASRASSPLTRSASSPSWAARVSRPASRCSSRARSARPRSRLARSAPSSPRASAAALLRVDGSPRAARSRARSASPLVSSSKRAAMVAAAASTSASSARRRAASSSRAAMRAESTLTARSRSTDRRRSATTATRPRVRSRSASNRPTVSPRRARPSSDTRVSAAATDASSTSSSAFTRARSPLRPAPACTAASWRTAEGGHLPAPQEHPQGVQLAHQVAVAAGGLGLALQGPQLAPDLPQQVGEADQVGLRPLQPPLRLLLAPAVLEDARRLLHDQAAVLGPGVEDAVEVSLGDDDVLLAAHAAVGEQFLEVEQPARDAVEGVLALPRRAKQRAGDGDLGEVDRQHAPGVVDGEADLGPAQRRPAAGAGEDDVVHLGGAHRAGPLGAQHPRHRVDHVGLPAAVRADDDRQPRLELESGRLGEGLEALQGERTKKHRCSEASWTPT